VSSDFGNFFTACRFRRGAFDLTVKPARACTVSLSRFSILKPNGESQMRFMVMVRADKSSESGALPSAELLEAMGRFNEELVKAGIMLAGEGLQPSSKGARVRFSGKDRIVVDGPFAETKELIAGYWLWQCQSKEEAIEWVKRCPNPLEGDSVIEIRQVYEAEDFGSNLSSDQREAEDRLREQIADLGKQLSSKR